MPSFQPSVAPWIEAHPAPRAVISPFARFGLGLASLDYATASNQPHELHLYPIAMLAVGPQLTVWHLFLRVRGTVTLAAPKSFLGWGLELGALTDP